MSNRLNAKKKPVNALRGMDRQALQNLSFTMSFSGVRETKGAQFNPETMANAALDQASCVVADALGKAGMLPSPKAAPRVPTAQENELEMIETAMLNACTYTDDQFKWLKTGPREWMVILPPR